jgi:hypothetical protein
MDTIFHGEQDFEWYKKKLDADAKYAHRHLGTPTKYPCKILESEWWDNPNGPYEYSHSFIYQQIQTCIQCGHTERIWPKIEEV